MAGSVAAMMMTSSSATNSSRWLLARGGQQRAVAWRSLVRQTQPKRSYIGTAPRGLSRTTMTAGPILATNGLDSYRVVSVVGGGGGGDGNGFPFRGRNTTTKKSLLFSTMSSLDHGEEEGLHHGHRPPVTSFSEDEEMIRDAARSWANDTLRPLVREMDDNGVLDPMVLEGLFQCGFMGMEIPEEYHGSGLQFTSACLVVEEIARVDPSVAILVDIHNTLTINAIRFWGSPELQKKWLPRLSTDTISAFALSEAGAGSDAFSMRTSAQISSDGSYYTLNGTKLWISNSKEAGVFLVFANTDFDKGYKGITAFLVDATTDGITVGPPEKKLGLRASSTCAINFEDVKVDATDVLGRVGYGYKYCINILNEGRIGIAAQQLGIAKGCMDVAMPYLAERKQFGTPIGDFQGMQHQYAQIATEIHAAEVMTYNACRMKEDGNLAFVKEASMCKLYASQVAERTASKCIEFLGGVGFTTDLLAEKFYRDCKVGSIYEGTSNIQLQTIAKQIQREYK